MKFLRQLISENSSLSSLRAMSLGCCLFACILAVYGVYKGIDLTGLSELCGVFLAAAFTGKVAQKHIEMKRG